MGRASITAMAVAPPGLSVSGRSVGQRGLGFRMMLCTTCRSWLLRKYLTQRGAVQARGCSRWEPASSSIADPASPARSRRRTSASLESSRVVRKALGRGAHRRADQRVQAAHILGALQSLVPEARPAGISAGSRHKRRHSNGRPTRRATVRGVSDRLRSHTRRGGAGRLDGGVTGSEDCRPGLARAHQVSRAVPLGRGYRVARRIRTSGARPPRRTLGPVRRILPDRPQFPGGLSASA
jgi:hypothetical protein